MDGELKESLCGMHDLCVCERERTASWEFPSLSSNELCRQHFAYRPINNALIKMEVASGNQG